MHSETEVSGQILTHSSETAPIHIQMQRLGARLKAFRLSRNMSQEQVADAAGIARRTVSQLETTGAGTIETLMRVLKALDLSERLIELVPDASIDPFNPASISGPARQRASSRDAKDRQTEAAPWTWGDE